jgi:hypothetical protein
MTSGNLGTKITSSDQVAQAEFDAKSILAEDGDVIEAIGTAVQIGLAHVIKDSVSLAFLKGDIMYPEYDTSMIRTAWRSIFWEHLHDGTGFKQGGSYKNILHANMDKAWIFRGLADPNEWNKTGDGTITRDVGTGVNTHDRISFKSTNVSGQAVTGNIGGIELGLEDLIDLQFYFEAEQNSDIFARAGINIDRIEDTQSDSRKQWGVECCPASGTNWVVISANGNPGNLLQVSTVIPINNEQRNFQLTYHPGVDVKFYHDGTLRATTNSANTPSSGNTDRNKLFVVGVKTNTGSIRELRLYHYSIVATPNNDEYYVAV